MKKIDAFINQYALSKTLRFKLIPVGATEQNFMAQKLLEEDVHRAESYKVVKECMNEYHRFFIDDVLSHIDSLDIAEYAELYFKKGKEDADFVRMRDIEAALRKKIAGEMTGHPDFKNMFGAEMIQKVLPTFVKDAEKKAAVEEFYDFAGYFTGFYENRENMYTEEAQATGIANRCINENLPKFLDNIRIFEQISQYLPAEHMESLEENYVGLLGHALTEVFSIDTFAKVLPQTGISLYNTIIGGYTTSDGEKVQGINEYINQYNQTHDRSERLPHMKQLFKQILSDKVTVSFLPEAFTSDEEAVSAIDFFYQSIMDAETGCLPRMQKLVSEMDTCDPFGIYVKSGPAVAELSHQMFGNWRAIRDMWEANYDARYVGKAKPDTEKYVLEREKVWKRVTSFDLSSLQHLIDTQRPGTNVVSFFKRAFADSMSKIAAAYRGAEHLLSVPYVDKPKRLAKNDGDIALLKGFLDSMKDLEWLVKLLLGDGYEDNRDARFYTGFEDCFYEFRALDKLYDKVRNHITKKPYSTDKVKLNFQNSNLMSGWDKNKERDARTVILRKDGLYYLAIMGKGHNKVFTNAPAGNDGWEKMEYKLLPGPNKMLPKVFFAKGNLPFYQPSDRIMEIYTSGTFKKGAKFNVDDCHELIQFFQDSINKHPEWGVYGFQFRPATEYADISEFYHEVEQQGYNVKFRPISGDYIMEKVEEGSLFLFQIYSKDFSPYSKGTPNLHTMYFKMLFDERNLEAGVYRLNGGGEIFYRFPSIKPEERVIHPKNEPVKNKNPQNAKSHSLFEYDLIKNKRYTVPQFTLHVPIKMNCRSEGNERINLSVRHALRNSDSNYIIGVNRGERNLIYITVVEAETGKIVEQFSCNEIVNTYNGQRHKVDYHELLNRKEEERMNARQSWTSIENIKELKEGYISQVVHKICQLIEKYDAIVAMENLDSGFKNSRCKVEKQVYQKFEKMLIDKLCYYVNKKTAPDANGGLLNAYQLAEKTAAMSRMGTQNGIIFFMPPWLISNMDPTTGFVDLLRPKYTSIAEAKKLIEKFKNIRYNEAENLFELTFNYHDFATGASDAKGTWTICSYGDRVEMRRADNENGAFVYEPINLTHAWADLFDEYGIDYHAGDLRQAMLKQTEKGFFNNFIRHLRLTLQMRNSGAGPDVDYLISPVRNDSGEFFDSRKQGKDSDLPSDIDANGAYNIARKAAYAITVLKNTPDDQLFKAKLSVSNQDWLEYAQLGQ